MPSNPPFDIAMTRSPGAGLRCDRVNDVVDLRNIASVLAGSVEIGDDLLGRQPLILRQRRAKDGRQQDAIGGREGAGEIGLEDPPARRRRTRLENRPDATAGIRGAHACERLRDRRRMMREVVVDRHARGRPAPLHAPPDALEPRRPAATVSGLRPTAAATAIAAVALRTLCAPSSGSSNVADRLPLPPQAERRRSLGHAQIVGLPVGAVRQAERLDRAARVHRERFRFRDRRRRAAAARGAERGSRSRRNATRIASRSG